MLASRFATPLNTQNQSEYLSHCNNEQKSKIFQDNYYHEPNNQEYKEHHQDAVDSVRHLQKIIQGPLLTPSMKRSG